MIMIPIVGKQVDLTGWWFQLCFTVYSSLFGEMIQLDPDFSNGLNPPTRFTILQDPSVVIPNL